MQIADKHIREIQDLQHALLDFSKRNPNIHYSQSKHFIELSDLNLILDLSKGNSAIIGPESNLVNEINNLRLKANRNSRELGTNALNLISQFIYWHNPNKVDELICSPLVLHSIVIKKLKGVSEQYKLEIEEDAVLNPYLLNYWQEIFGFEGHPVSLQTKDIISWLVWNDSKLQIFDHDNFDKKDPYSWFIQDKKRTIGNFDFRKMSILKDYDKIKKDPTLFTSLTMLKSDDHLKNQSFNLYNVLPTDPSQEKVISSSINQQNIVVQGPPGTGKSQTLINLAANLLGKGKKVLIVSEKMAALQVVIDRLTQVGLGDLALLAKNDSSQRKKLIKNLKSSYVQALDFDEDLGAINYIRKKTLDEIKIVEAGLKRYFTQLQEKDDHGFSLQDIYDLRLQLSDKRHDLEKLSIQQLPGIHEFIQFEGELDELNKFMKSLAYSSVFKDHPVAQLNQNVWVDDKAEFRINELVSKLKSNSHVFEKIRLLGWSNLTLSEIQINCINASFLNKLNEFGLIDLAFEDSKLSRKYDKLRKRLKKFNTKINPDESTLKNWNTKPQTEELSQALELLEKGEKSWLYKLKPSYKKCIKNIRKNYNFNRHIIEPSLAQVLKNTKSELFHVNSIEKTRSELVLLLNTDQLELIDAIVQDVRRKIAAQEIGVLSFAFDDQLKLNSVIELAHSYENFYRDAKSLFHEATNRTCDDLLDCITNMEGVKDELYGWTHYLSKVAKSGTIYNLIRVAEVPLENVKSLVLDYEINNRLNLRYWLKQNDAFTVKMAFEKLSKLSGQLREHNANWISAKTDQSLNTSLKITETSASKLSEEDKLKKRKLKKARRILEHEFSKSKRHKSLRELIDEDCLEILLNLKPLWLMSPQGVADNLPLNAVFDVIIFDEASQVRFEEGFPSLLRANNCVIVGDEMQLPPSNFFSSSTSKVAPSLLAYFSSRLRNLDLKWHYRSRNSDLIEFSNKRFYDNKLIVVPDPKLEQSPVRLVRLEKGRYVQRRNIEEALAVVDELNSCLKEGIKSIAIVALSLEQMSSIEQEIERKCSDDPIFSMLYEQAMNNEEINGHDGLIIRNLENIQGDERDVVIISIGYGPNEEGKVLQHFGPINNEGGDKRLNVLLTRAKHQMISITSMFSSDVTGGSDGALTLRAFLTWLETKSLNASIHKKQRNRNMYLSCVSKELELIDTALQTSHLLDNKGTMLHLLELKGINAHHEFDLFGQKKWGTICYDAHTLYHKAKLFKSLLG